MAVKIGSARIDERGKASGGQAGDQTGREVSTQAYYDHSKGWDVLRPKKQRVASMLADNMEKACRNSNIGYDQSERKTLFNNVKSKGFDASKTTKKVETDCSQLVCVCANYAGVPVGDFITSNEKEKLLATGEFVELTGDKYRKGGRYLRRGDVLVTRTKGHTAIVLSDGDKADADSWHYTDEVKELTVTVKPGQWYVRSGASKLCGAVTVVKEGEVLTVLDKKDGWLCVSGKDRNGKAFTDAWISENGVK